jgi:hypothetical protein
MSNHHVERGLRRTLDRNSLRAVLEHDFEKVKPNSDCSVEVWAESAIVNLKAIVAEQGEEIIEAFNNGYAAGRESVLRRWIRFMQENHRYEHAKLVSELIEQLGEECAPRTVPPVVPYTVGEDVSDED